MNAERGDQPMPDNHGIPGKTLAAQREEMGWTVEQVADQLKLAVRQVQALEQGDYANLPPPAVVRGFVRAYAKVVKLDAAPLVAQIALDSQAAPDTSPTVVRRDKPTSFSQSRFPSNGKRTSKLPLGLIAAVVLAVGAGVAAWQFDIIPGSLFGSSAPATATNGATSSDSTVTVLPPPIQAGPSAPDAPANAKPVEAHPPVINNSVPLISVPPVTNAGTTPAANAPTAAAPAATAATAAAAVAASPNALVLNVREDSWIEVRPANNGPALFSGMVKGGTIEIVNVSGPATLIVGKPSAVDATLRGVAVKLPAVSGGRVARVPLK